MSTDKQTKNCGRKKTKIKPSQCSPSDILLRLCSVFGWNQQDYFWLLSQNRHSAISIIKVQEIFRYQWKTEEGLTCNRWPHFVSLCQWLRRDAADLGLGQKRKGVKMQQKCEIWGIGCHNHIQNLHKPHGPVHMELWFFISWRTIFQIKSTFWALYVIMRHYWSTTTLVR